MTTTSADEFDRLLLDGTDSLVEEFQGEVAAAKVQAAVERARQSVRDSFARIGLDPHPPDENVALIIGLARRTLHGQSPDNPAGTP